ncbi:ras-related protein Rab-1C-like isoform X1 [Orbicella faveolata]|uniref:ras-related protein Rab-1C-like isoform X1 n=1 Tax=Orbicella faveolata TaxID=48498 RepID=UPI0009E22BD1|nr:ras-related protein Rab-1C-like isoform X1 [Orbicella faveolata]
MAEEECEIKIAVVGESGVGKSCIISSFCSSKEGETTEGNGGKLHGSPTHSKHANSVSPAGQEITIEKIEVEGKEIRLQIIDAAGTKDIRKSLFKGARVSITYCKILLLEEQGPDLKH